MNEFIEFLKTLSDMELVVLQKEARQVNDKETLNAVLVELGRRQKQARGDNEADSGLSPQGA